MRRGVCGLLSGAVLVVMLTAPASASRDPFRPLVSQTSAPSTSSTTTTATSSTTTSSTGASAIRTPAQPTDASPNTGFDATGWAILAVVLLLTGGGLMLISRLLGPARIRSVEPVSR